MQNVVTWTKCPVGLTPSNTTPSHFIKKFYYIIRGLSIDSTSSELVMSGKYKYENLIILGLYRTGRMCYNIESDFNSQWL